MANGLAKNAAGQAGFSGMAKSAKNVPKTPW